MSHQQLVTKKESRGFTLVEIMIVVLIVGILLAIAIPNFVTSRAQSRYQQVIANLKQIETAKTQFAMERQLITGTVVNNSTDLTPTFMENWPTGPLAVSDYEANPIGTDPTYNGASATTLQTECGNLGSACPF